MLSIDWFENVYHACVYFRFIIYILVGFNMYMPTTELVEIRIR